MTVEEYEERRHRDVNFSIEKADKNKDEKGFNSLVTKWYRSRNTKKNWDQVTKRLYATARKRLWPAMKRRLITDLQRAPQLTGAVIEYILYLENADVYLDELLKLWNREEGNTERLIHFAKYLCDASFSPEASKRIADFAVGRVLDDDDRPGSGYARALLLLALHKHGNYKHRQKILQWASVETLKDEQLRLHFLYVFTCREELDETLRSALLPLISSDIDLLLRLCAQAQARKVRKTGKILRRYVRRRGNHRSVEARVLPFIAALVRSRSDGVQVWLEGVLEPRSKSSLPICDVVLRAMLETMHKDMVS